jgi:hypothetical protein
MSRTADIDETALTPSRQCHHAPVKWHSLHPTMTLRDIYNDLTVQARNEIAQATAVRDPTVLQRGPRKARKYTV